MGDDVRIDAFIDALWMERGLAVNTLAAYRTDLRQFADWLAERGIALEFATRSDLLEYLSQQAGSPPRTMARRLSSLRRFYAHLLREGVRDDDPSVEVASPRIGRRLPGALTESEVEALLAVPDSATPIGQRDRSMLEVLYATGLRVSELVDLAMHAVNLRQGVVRVMGKGAKERLVPMGEEAAAQLQSFLDDGRPALLKGRVSDAVFPTRNATAMTRQAFWQLIKRHAVGQTGEQSNPDRSR